MESLDNEEIIQTAPKRPPRYCQACGVRVAEGAKTCLMCGALLEDEAAEPEPEASETSSKFRWVRIVILVIVALAILGGSVVLGWNLSQGNLGPELPTFTPTITRTPTVTPTPTTTSTPTVTPTPTMTPTPLPPETYIVQADDNLLSIAIKFDMTVEELKDYNDLDSDIIVVGQSLLIPPPTPTPGPTATLRPGEASPTPAPYILYTVRRGDTLSTIAEEFGVSMDDIRDASGIAADSERIVVDQVLTIPQYTPTPAPQENIYVSGTATPRAAYPPPALLYPPDEHVFSGENAVIVLQWASVGILDEREFYQVEFIVPTAEGKNTVYDYVRSTAWRVPVDWFPGASTTDRECAWRVSVVRQVTEGEDANYKIISRMDRRRSFVWDVAPGDAD